MTSRVRVIGYLVLAGLVAALSRHLAQVPPGYELFLRVCTGLRALVYLAVLSGSAYAAGRRIAGACDLAPPDEGLATALALTLGLAALGLASLALGYAGLVHPLAAYALVAAAALAGARHLGELPGRIAGLTSPRGASLFYPVIALVLGLTFLDALAPPVFGDEGAYQAFLPHLFARTGAIPPGGSKYLCYPLFCHALAGMGIAAGVPEAPRLDQWLFGAVLLVGLAGWARRMSAPPGLAVTLYLGVPIALVALFLSYVTTAKTLFQTMVLVALVELAEEPSRRRAVGLGLLVGAFLWVKQVALATVAFLGLALVAGWPARRSLIALALVVAGLVAGPFYVKNAYVTGDPLYPLLWPRVQGRGWSALMAYNELYSYKEIENERPVELLPAVAAILIGPDRSNYEGPGLGALVVGLAPALFLVPGSLPRRPAAILALFGPFYVALWAFSRGPLMSRVLLPVVPALCLALAAALGRLKRTGGPWLAAALNVGVLVVIASTLPARQLASGLPYVMGLETELQTRARECGDVARALALLDQVLPPGTRVLALDSGSWPLFTHCALVLSKDQEGQFALDTEPTHEFLRRAARAFPAILPAAGLPPPELSSREDARAAMAKRGLEYLLIAKGKEPEARGYTVLGLLERDLQVVFDAHGFRLYRVRVR